jgi:hypothetical protein
MYSSWMVTFQHSCVFGAGNDDDGNDDNDWYSFHRLLTWQLWGNNLFQAILFQLYLQTYCEGLMFFFSFLCGYQIMPIMKNPVFASQSPSNFWGRRWNLLVHHALKNGVFKPACTCRYVSKTAAVAATIIVSGIFHEWVLLSLHAPIPHAHRHDHHESGSGTVVVVYGSATVFFLWQGILVSIEAMVGHWSMFTKLDKILPMPLRTTLIIASGIPVSIHVCMHVSMYICMYSLRYTISIQLVVVAVAPLYIYTVHIYACTACTIVPTHHHSYHTTVLLTLTPTVAFVWIPSFLPIYIYTVYIICMYCMYQLAHYFADPYVRSSFFHHGMVALPTIYRINQ